MTRYWPAGGNYTYKENIGEITRSGKYVCANGWEHAYTMAKRYDPINGENLVDIAKQNPEWCNRDGDPIFQAGPWHIVVLGVMNTEW